MLTSPSFNTKKLTRSMDLRSQSLSKDSSLYTPRISAMNSVAKSVKYNNLSFITGQQICKLRRQPEDGIQDPEYLATHNNMSHIRKKSDNIMQQKFYLQNKISRLNQQATKFKQKQMEFQQGKEQGKQSVKSMQTKLQNIKLELLNRQYQKKSMEQMTEVIRKDKIVYDKRKYDMNKYLQNLEIKIKSINKQFFSKNQEDDRVVKVYDKLIKRLDKQKNEREEHINSMQQRIMEKESLNNSTVLRKSQMGLIAQQAMTDRDPKQKQWLKLFQVHKILQKMLKSKIQRQMLKFTVVQQAFKNIKISTGVSDAKTMVIKFLSKQQIYGDLLSKITENEKQIQTLKKQQENYQKEIKKSQQEIHLLQISKPHLGDLREQLKEAENIDNKRKSCDLHQKKLRYYLIKHGKVLGKNSLQNPNYQQKTQQREANNQIRSREQIKNELIKQLTLISNLVQEVGKMDVNLQEKGFKLEPVSQQQILTRLFRIKPHIPLPMAYNNSAKQSIFSKTSELSELVQHFDQQQITAASEDVQMIQQQRVNMFKNNQKFMRELKNRKEEEKSKEYKGKGTRCTRKKGGAAPRVKQSVTQIKEKD